MLSAAGAMENWSIWYCSSRRGRRKGVDGECRFALQTSPAGECDELAQRSWVIGGPDKELHAIFDVGRVFREPEVQSAVVVHDENIATGGLHGVFSQLGSDCYPVGGRVGADRAGVFWVRSVERWADEDRKRINLRRLATRPVT